MNELGVLVGLRDHACNERLGAEACKGTRGVTVTSFYIRSFVIAA